MERIRDPEQDREEIMGSRRSGRRRWHEPRWQKAYAGAAVERGWFTVARSAGAVPPATVWWCGGVAGRWQTAAVTPAAQRYNPSPYHRLLGGQGVGQVLVLSFASRAKAGGSQAGARQQPVVNCTTGQNPGRVGKVLGAGGCVGR